MNIILDANARDCGYANLQARLGHYVFLVQADPSVPIQRVRGVSYVRKNIAPTWTTVTYNGDGQALVVPAMDVMSFSKDVGVQQWDIVRLDDDRAADILAKWPGPVARRILTRVIVPEVTARHLRQWYVEVGTDWEIAERAI